MLLILNRCTSFDGYMKYSKVNIYRNTLRFWKEIDRNLPFPLLNSMVATPFGAGPITRSVWVGASSGIWLTTTWDNVNWPDGISLLSLSTDANVMPLLLISLMTFVGGSEEVEIVSIFLICSLELCSEWRMPFFPFTTLGVLLLIICKPFELAVRIDWIDEIPFVNGWCTAFIFKFNGIADAAFDAFNSAGDIPSDVDKLMAIGGLCAFKPFEMAVRPLGRILGESKRKKKQNYY